MPASSIKEYATTSCKPLLNPGHVVQPSYTCPTSFASTCCISSLALSASKHSKSKNIKLFSVSVPPSLLLLLLLLLLLCLLWINLKWRGRLWEQRVLLLKMERSLTMVVVLGYCLIGGMILRSQNNGKEAFTMLYVHLMPWSPSSPWYVPFISGNWISYHGLSSSFFFFSFFLII